MAEHKQGSAMGNGEVKFSSLSTVMQGILVLLTILGMVVPATLGFVNFDKRLDIQETITNNHIEKDEAKWISVDLDIDELDDDIHSLQLVDKELLIHYNEILRRLEKAEINDQRILDKLNTFERAGNEH